MSLFILREKSSEYLPSNTEKIDVLKSLQNPEFHEFAKNNFNINKLKVYNFPHTIKFRRWKQSWSLPKNLDIDLGIVKYSNSRSNQHIIKRTLWAEVESLNRYRTTTKKPSDYWRGAIQLKINNYRVYIKIHNNWYFNYSPNYLDFSYKNKWLYLKVPQDKVAMNYFSSDMHSNFIIVPRNIKLNEFFFEGLGLQQGDGTQSFGNVHITFTNTNLDLILHQIKWFENLGIDKNSIRIYPELPKVKFNTEFNNMKKILCSNGIHNEQFRKPKIGKNCVKPNIQIVFHNKLFKILYLFLLKHLKHIIFTNKDYLKSYVKGLFASEGCIRTDNSTGIPLTVKVSVKSKQRREFYRKCLIELGIKTSKDELTPNSEALIITHSNNFKKIRNYNLLSLHKEKENKFIKGIENYQRKKIMEGLNI